MSRILFPLFLLLSLLPMFSSCSADEAPDTRTPEDILGVWTDGNGRYLYFFSETTVFDLRLIGKDSDPAYTLMQDSYFYEPGYNFVVFMDFMKGMEDNANDSSNWEDLVSPDVFEVTQLTPERLTWCLVDNLTDPKYKGMSKKEILGRLLQEADKGFTLLPENYQTFTAVSQEDFDRIIEEYNIWELSDDPLEDF